jgi:hypothetical protein
MPNASAACILNDTSEWYHWGCYGSSLGLQGLVERVLEPAAIATVPIKFSYAPSYLPDGPEAMRDPRAAVEFLKTWQVAHVLLEASDIVINGEGTIHGASGVARRLLYIAYLCGTFLGKRVHLVNSSLFPPQDDAKTLELYQLACGSLHRLAVRESDSAGIARDLLGREARLAFDCLPLTLEKTVLQPRPAVADFAIVTGSSGLDDAMLEILQTGAKLLAQQGLRIIWLVGAPRNPAPDEESQATNFAAAIGAEVVTAQSFEAWAALIRDASFVFTGRFHYLIARLCLGGAFAAFGGNTPKITALLRDQGLPNLTIQNESEVAATIARALSLTMPPRVSTLARAAADNFAT